MCQAPKVRSHLAPFCCFIRAIKSDFHFGVLWVFPFMASL
jgi:hypothetical protein